MNSNIWIPRNKILPNKDGTYLVITARGKVRMDRFVDGAWGLCLARPSNNKGRYKPHLAWAFLPRIPKFDEEGNML